MPDRPCPACHEPVAAHQTLCPACRAPVPSEAGPVAADTSAFTFSAPPPRQPRSTPAPPAPAPAAPAPSAPEPGPFPELGGESARNLSPSPPSSAGVGVAPPQPGFAGTIGTPGAAVLDERGNLPGGVAGLLAALLIAVGVFLPWIAVEGRDVSGWSASADAKVLLVLAAVATVGAALLIAGARSLALRLGLAGLGVVVAVVVAVDVASAGGIEDFDVDLGLGLIVAGAGGLLLAVAGALTRHRRYRQV